MHILFLSIGYPVKSDPIQGIFYRDQAEAMAAAGHQAGLLVVKPISLKSIIASNVLEWGTRRFIKEHVQTIIHLYPKLPGWNSIVFRKLRRKGLKLYTEYESKYGRPDIIHVQGFEAGSLARIIKSRLGISYVVTEHSSGFITGVFKGQALEEARATFIESAENIAVSEVFAEKLSGIFGREFIYIPNIVDTDLYQSGSRNDEVLQIVSIGNLTRNKNQLMLLQACRELLQNSDSWHLTIIGSGPQEKVLKEYVQKNQLERYVTLTGLLPRTEIANLLSKSHVLVSTSHHETFGVVLIEAMSAGNYLISTRSGGPSSIIIDSMLGSLVNHDVKDLARLLNELRTGVIKPDRSAIREHAVKTFSRMAVAARLQQVYSKVLQEVSEKYGTAKREHYDQ